MVSPALLQQMCEKQPELLHTVLTLESAVQSLFVDLFFLGGGVVFYSNIFLKDQSEDIQGCNLLIFGFRCFFFRPVFFVGGLEPNQLAENPTL